jgi:hypothetical protein
MSRLAAPSQTAELRLTCGVLMPVVPQLAPTRGTRSGEAAAGADSVGLLYGKKRTPIQRPTRTALMSRSRPTRRHRGNDRQFPTSLDHLVIVGRQHLVHVLGG